MIVSHTSRTQRGVECTVGITRGHTSDYVRRIACIRGDTFTSVVVRNLKHRPCLISAIVVQPAVGNEPVCFASRDGTAAHATNWHESPNVVIQPAPPGVPPNAAAFYCEVWSVSEIEKSTRLNARVEYQFQTGRDIRIDHSVDLAALRERA